MAFKSLNHGEALNRLMSLKAVKTSISLTTKPDQHSLADVLKYVSSKGKDFTCSTEDLR